MWPKKPKSAPIPTQRRPLLLESLEDRTLPSGASALSVLPISDSASGTSFSPSVSADGRFAVFLSSATDLVPGQSDMNHGPDVFLFDRSTGTTTLVSHSSSSVSVTGDDSSRQASISVDGRFVVFVSLADDLVANQDDSNGSFDIFLYDRTTGNNTLVSHTSAASLTAANDLSLFPSMSADGRFVAFQSLATDLVSGQDDTNSTNDIFLYDRLSGGLTLVSHTATSNQVAGDASSTFPLISSDGSFVAFDSVATQLTPGQSDSNADNDVFLFDRSTGNNVLVSGSNGSSTQTADAGSDLAAINANGGSVVFTSLATDLIPGEQDTNDGPDIFEFKRSTLANTLVSHTSASASTAGNGDSGPASVSADGRFVAFLSYSTDLVAGQVDQNQSLDLFLFDGQGGTCKLVSHASGSNVVAANAPSDELQISSDGNFIIFGSQATNLIAGQTDTNNDDDVFLFSRATSTTSLVSHSSASSTATGNQGSFIPALDSDAHFPAASISADGKTISFQALASNLAEGFSDSNGQQDVLFYDAATSSNTLLSRRDVSVQTADGVSSHPSVSADGRFIAFESNAVNLTPGEGEILGNPNQIYLTDRTTGTTTLVSRTDTTHTNGGNSPSDSPVLSADGRFVVFVSNATDLLASQNDVNNAFDVFLYDRTTGSISLVSHTPNSASTTGDGESSSPVISADGTWIAFTSLAMNLIPGQGKTTSVPDIYLYNRATGQITLVDHVAGQQMVPDGGAYSINPVMSSDGNFIAFQSLAQSLVLDQTQNSSSNVFLYDRVGDTVTLLSHAAAPNPATQTANDYSANPTISADGRFVAFESAATDLIDSVVEGNTELPDIFLYDRIAGTLTLVSHVPSSPNTTSNDASLSPIISADGSAIAFTSMSTDLVAGQTDTNNADDVFLYNRRTGTIQLVSHNNTSAMTTGNDASDNPVLSADGSKVAFVSRASNLAPGQVDANTATDVFRFDRATGLIRLASHTSLVPNSAGDSASDNPSMSSDGSFVAFASMADNLVSGDFNGQSDIFGFVNQSADVVGRVSQTGQWWIAQSTGSSFTNALWTTWNPTVTWVDVMTGDFNGDGKDDVLARDLTSGNWWIGLSTGSSFSVNLWTTWSHAVTWVDVQTADLNGDGRADVIGRDLQSGNWWASLSAGSKVLSTTRWAAWSPAVTWTDVRIGDLNGDSKSDVIGRVLQSGQWWASLSNGPTALSTTLWATWSPAVTWADVRMGDLNADGKADIIGRVQQAGQWWASLSSGSVVLSTTLWSTWSTAVTWVDVEVADFNGDGKDDIIGRVLQSGQWWLGSSTGSSFSNSLWTTWNAKVAWVDVQVGDFNGDHLADITGRVLSSGQWWTELSTGASFAKSLWAAWSPAVSWADVRSGQFTF